jgi:hypothetical protein
MFILREACSRLTHDSVPISLRIGVRANVCGDSQRGDRCDVAGHPGQQSAVLVHGRAYISAACVFAPFTPLIFVVHFEWLCAWECTVFALRTWVQRALVYARTVRTVAGAAVPGSVTNIVRTCGGPGRDHPRVGRSRANFTHDGVAGTVSAGALLLTSVISIPVVPFSLVILSVHGDSFWFLVFLPFPSLFFRIYSLSTHTNVVLLSSGVLFEYAVSTASVLSDFFVGLPGSDPAFSHVFNSYLFPHPNLPLFLVFFCFSAITFSFFSSSIHLFNFCSFVTTRNHTTIHIS